MNFKINILTKERIANLALVSYGIMPINKISSHDDTLK